MDRQGRRGTVPGWLGIPGIRHSIGLARWWHFSFGLLWIINGIVVYALLCWTDQWQRLVPTTWEVFPNAVSTALQYLSLQQNPKKAESACKIASQPCVKRGSEFDPTQRRPRPSAYVFSPSVKNKGGDNEKNNHGREPRGVAYIASCCAGPGWCLRLGQHHLPK